MTSAEPSASRRSYREYCAIARALDVLGERWTLLVVRDLLMGPRRYTDLRASLPGIATDILTTRLRTLEAAGFIRRRQLPPPVPATVYELSEAGGQLVPVVAALGRVGVGLLDAPAPDELVQAEPVVLSLHLTFRAQAFPELDEIYGLEIDGLPFAVHVTQGTARAERGAAPGAAMTLRGEARTLVALLRGDTAPADVLAAGRIEVEGERAALGRFVAAFGPVARG